MKHYGDITELKGYMLPEVEVVTGGSPCQDLSVAGKRDGLDGARSGLFMEQIRVIKEMRENDQLINDTEGADIKPRFMVWENVPGAFSSNKGEDFRAVLEETAKVCDETTTIPEPHKGKWHNSGAIMGDGWSIAWRVFDAQFWGVPQRRRRIYLVADFGGHTAPEILFKREGLPGYPQKSSEQRQGIAAGTQGGLGEASRVASCLTATYGTKWNGNSGAYSGGNFVIEGEGGGRGYVARGFDKEKPGGLDETEPIAVATQQGGAEISDNGICPTVTAAAGMSGNNQPWICSKPTISIEMGDNRPCVAPNTAYGVVSKGNGDAFLSEERHMSLGCGGGQAGQGYPCVLAIENHPADSRVTIDDSGTIQTLTSRMGTGGGNVPMTMQMRSGKEGGGKGPLIQEDLSATLTAGNTHYLFEPVYALDQQGGKGAAHFTEDVAPTLLSDSHGTPHAVAYGMSSYASNAMLSSNPHSGVYEAETSRTLDLNGGNPACNQGGIMVVNNPIHSLETYHCENHEETASTLKARDWKDPQCINQQSVRRLTPLECERLQGFPDGWTDIQELPEDLNFWRKVWDTFQNISGKKPKTDKAILTWLKNPTSDSGRYKALGNSVALPNTYFVLYGIAEQLGFKGTLGSLFDGIGGFPICWESICGKGTALWASEIEPFPIAVTKHHFTEED